MATYLVTGAPDVSPSDQNVRRSGRRVRFDTQVPNRAASAIRAGRRYVVIAHGDSEGTVFWFRSDLGSSVKWMWVGMRDAPRAARVYLYCCHVGPELTRFLKRCESFGHCSSVPAPVDEAEAIVLDYLSKVDELMRRNTFDAGNWRKELQDHVAQRLSDELDVGTSVRSISTWLMLGNSLRK